jgi:hypothetical protein
MTEIRTAPEKVDSVYGLHPMNPALPVELATACQLCIHCTVTAAMGLEIAHSTHTMHVVCIAPRGLCFPAANPADAFGLFLILSGARFAILAGWHSGHLNLSNHRMGLLRPGKRLLFSGGSRKPSWRRVHRSDARRKAAQEGLNHSSTLYEGAS